jgi:hypothetical protein
MRVLRQIKKKQYNSLNAANSYRCNTHLGNYAPIKDNIIANSKDNDEECSSEIILTRLLVRCTSEAFARKCIQRPFAATAKTQGFVNAAATHT